MVGLAGTTINRLPTTLATLPAPSEVDFGGLPPWGVIPTGDVIRTLGIDRGNWGTWRNRGIGPAELPPGWFKRTTGGPVHYRLDSIQGWLASRRGERFDQRAAWIASLAAVGLPTDLVWVRRLAERAGPGDMPFSPSGFQAYLSSLSAAA